LKAVTVFYVLLGTAAALLLLNMMTGLSTARTITVNDDGGADYTCIQDAVDAAGEGDTVRVFSGTYYENVWVNITLNLIGNGSDDTIIDARDIGSAITVRSDWVNISGFKVTKWGKDPFNAGIEIMPYREHVAIMNNNISNKNFGIRLRTGCSDIHVVDNIISNCGQGIRFSTAHHSYISGNAFINSYLFMSDSRNNTISNNTFMGHKISLSNGLKISYHSDDNLIDNNRFICYKYGAMHLSKNRGNVIKNNTFDGNRDFGIFIDECSFISVENCTVINCFYGNGIEIRMSNNISLNNNSVKNCMVHGISIFLSEHNVFSNNSLTGNSFFLVASRLKQWNTHLIDTTNLVNDKPVYYLTDLEGITVPAGAGEIIIVNCSRVKIEHQNLSGGSVGIIAAYSSNVSLTKNICNKNRAFGIYCLGMGYSNVENNTCSSNGEMGLYLNWEDDCYNIVSNNTCLNNECGIYISNRNSAI